jgi:hypothetical protein
MKVTVTRHTLEIVQANGAEPAQSNIEVIEGANDAPRELAVGMCCAVWRIVAEAMLSATSRNKQLVAGWRD